jgi:cadmium resistance protein CadD (predicted permease)
VSISDLLALVGVASVAFLSTNADNLALLFAFLADHSFSARNVIFGYALGMLLILGLSWVISWLADFFPHQYVGFLGVVPIFLGIKRLYHSFASRKSEAGSTAITSKRSQVITVALADVAHGPDTVVIFSALLADSDAAAQSAVTATYILLVMVWCFFGSYLFRHPRIRGPVQRYGNRFAPYLLIGVGVFILLNTAHDLRAP